MSKNGHLVYLFDFYLQVMNLIGDVKGKVAVMVDDMIDTAGKHYISKLILLLYVPKYCQIYFFLDSGRLIDVSLGNKKGCFFEGILQITSWLFN